MGIRNIKKQLIGKEDLDLGFDTVIQERNGKNLEITRINASTIPYTSDKSIAEALSTATVTVDTINDFPASATTGDTCIVKDLDRGGIFIYDSTKVDEDNQGTNFNGWIRQYSGALDARWFGAKGDWNGITGTDDTDALQNAIIFSSANLKKLLVSDGSYRVTKQLYTKSNLHMVFTNNAWIVPTEWSNVGATLSNVIFGDFAARIQENITIENPQFDGAFLPYDLVSNDNALGFAWGATNVKVIGGNIKNYAFSYTEGGAGGKAVNFEQGVYGGYCTGLTATNCGVGVFVQGLDGTLSNGEKKATTNIIISDIFAENCEAAIAVLGINTASSPDGDPSDQLVIIDNVTFHNCGHMPNRPVSSWFEKSGVIVIGEGQNVRISNVKGYNDVGYPSSYPTGGTVVGSGLSGPIGAVIWGCGRNISISNVEYHGNCDALIQINRARAIGEDASPDGVIKNVFKFHVDNLKHYGTSNYVVDIQAGSIKPLVSMVETDFTNIYPDNLTTGFVSANLNGYTRINLELINTKVGSIKNIVRGDANSLHDSRNTFESLSTGTVINNVDSGYEFGVFTPEVRDAPTGNIATQVISIGRYTKHGKRVFFEINLVNINTSGLTAGNQIHITNMPYESLDYYPAAVIPQKVAGSLVTQTTGVFGSIVSGTNYMKLYNELTTGYQNLLVSSITSGTGDIFISGSYEVLI